MKYVIWMYNNHKYFQSLFPLFKDNLDILPKLYSLNKNKTHFIVTNRLIMLFNFFKFLLNKSNSISIELLFQYTDKNLKKLNNIISQINEEDYDNFIMLLYISALDKITKHNIKDLMRYVRSYSSFISCGIKIQWGVGNNKNISSNILNHYIKHTSSLSDEGIIWDKILYNQLEEITECEKIKLYEIYAIKSFYLMKDVIVHSNGINTYMSGFYGNIFIIGRYNGEEFGISSCYYVEGGKKFGREKDKCFSIVFKN
jgi:hypothetical protein